MSRPRHPNKELEAVLREAESRPKPWRVSKGKKYFKLWCACEAKHRRTVHLTPSDPHYERNLRQWLERQPCWNAKEEGEQ